MSSGFDQSYRSRSHTPMEPSVTSAHVSPLSWTLRNESALLPQISDRPGLKSISPARNCSGVAVVVSVMSIVAMLDSLIRPHTSQRVGRCRQRRIRSADGVEQQTYGSLPGRRGVGGRAGGTAGG